MEFSQEIDLTLALQLQAHFEEELRVLRVKEEETVQILSKKAFKWTAKNQELPEPEQEKLTVSLIDPSWEVLDPNPEIHSLFLTFNSQFFWGRLSGIEVKWSPRMTLCAGVCSYDGRGGLCSVRLSLPLLKLRPRKDLIETLLHEMIHAYLFVTHNNTDHDGHGPNFHSHMHRINKLAGTKISVYHSFHDEVAVYRQHIWQCNGPCKNRRPFFGLVKRSMNRAPSSRDFWWSRHQKECGGTYTKIQEPEGYGTKRKRTNDKENLNKKISLDIRSFFPKETSTAQKSVNKVGSFQSSSDIKTHNVPVLGASESNVHGFWSKEPKHQGAGSSFPLVSKTLVTKSGDKSTGVPSSEVFQSFSGSGRALGGSESTRASRLLSKTHSGASPSFSLGRVSNSQFKPSTYDSKVKGTKSTPFTVQTKLPFSKSKDAESKPKSVISSSQFENSRSKSQPSTSQSKMSFPKSKSPQSAPSISKCYDFPSQSGSSVNLDNSIIILSDDESTEQDLYPCPICAKKFCYTLIDNHTESHFT